jgi:hypothetical protein
MQKNGNLTQGVAEALVDATTGGKELFLDWVQVAL